MIIDYIIQYSGLAMLTVGNLHRKWWKYENIMPFLEKFRGISRTGSENPIEILVDCPVTSNGTEHT